MSNIYVYVHFVKEIVRGKQFTLSLTDGMFYLARVSGNHKPVPPRLRFGT